MALSTPPTLADLRASCRRELLDPVGRWWSNPELDQYINDWAHLLQSQYEFVWSTATVFTSSTSIPITGTITTSLNSYYTALMGTSTWTTTLTNLMRVDAVYYNQGPYNTNAGPAGTDTATTRLAPRTTADIDTYQWNWRQNTGTAGIPVQIVYQLDVAEIDLYPPPAGQCMVILEYPVLVSLSTSTSTLQLPYWLKFSCIPYVCYRALSRFGPNQNIPKAIRRKRQWEKQYNKIKQNWDNYLPDLGVIFRPGRRWAGQVLLAKPGWPTF